MTGEPELPLGAHLVPRVREVGGELATVLSWPQYADVTKGMQYALVGIVSANDDLNTVAAVDWLADAALYHGLELDDWWANLLEEHDLEHAVMALNTMRELGWRGEFVNDRAVEPTEVEDRLTLEELIEFIEQLHRLGVVMATVEGLVDFINDCGGWDVARGLGDDQILRLRDEPEYAAELVQAHLEATTPKMFQGRED